MGPSIKLRKRAWAEQMRQVPIGGLFLAQFDNPITRRCLYERSEKRFVRCLVSSDGAIDPHAHLDPSQATRTPIGNAWFHQNTEVILLPECEQTRRRMLINHRRGDLAVKPYKDEAA